jgi:predicted nucleotide-binding protein
MSPSQLKRPREDVERFVDEQIGAGAELLQRAPHVATQENYEEWTHSVERWDAYTADGLRTLYADEDPAEEFHRAATGRIGRRIGQTTDETFDYRQEAVRRGIHVLESLKERLDFAIPAVEGPTTADPASPGAAPSSRAVFVVHGRDEGLRDGVARVLDKLAFEPVILSEQPWKGRTVIEKFEDHSEVAEFAVVILSADDWGRGPDEQDCPDGPNRARQNVILELGYFMGRLGRRYVAALLGPGVEEPSDIRGLGYIALAESDWAFKLGAELAAAGFEVDLNRLS